MKGFSIEGRYVNGDPLARIVMIIDSEIKYERMYEHEDDTVSCIVIKILTSARKSVTIIGYYREWNLANHNVPYRTNKPEDQVHHFKKCMKLVRRQFWKEGRYLNI